MQVNFYLNLWGKVIYENLAHYAVYSELLFIYS